MTTADSSKDVMSYNGGALVAMAGKNCVAIGSDLRFGIRGQTLGANFPKHFEIEPRLYLGAVGLISDVQTVTENMKFHVNLYRLNENRPVKPSVFTAMLSKELYGKRFGPYHVETVVAGLEPNTYEPYVASLDVIGAINSSKYFAVAGTCRPQLHGMCECIWKPNMKPQDLFEVISQALLNAVDRDAISGSGATICIIEPDRVTTRTLKTRMD